ncbi:hypothetical protein [Algivirga pacifica]|uniref:DUF3592 domain-containing protein n=1 Tax=Algivirga pacifica TaxID=1162670 RepID=A0ABP9D8T8_9BACT
MILLTALAFITLFYFIINHLRNTHRKSKYVPVEATVIVQTMGGVDTDGHPGADVYVPLPYVRFTDLEGEVYEMLLKESPKYRYKKGDIITFFYNPYNINDHTFRVTERWSPTVFAASIVSFLISCVLLMILVHTI